MPIFTTSFRIIIAAWRNFTRNIWLALTTIFVLILALLSLNVLVGVNVLLTSAVRVLEEKIDVSVYFKPETPQAILEQAKFFMASLPQTRSAELQSAEAALADFKRRHADDPKVLAALEDVGKNPLGATLVLTARNTSGYPILLEALQNPQFNFAIESQTFDDHATTIRRVEEIRQSLRMFGMGLIAVFAFFSLLIVFNTIRVAIYTQREEIGVMRLVGASSAYVRLPFVLEGIFLALCALAVASGITVMVALYLDPRLVGVFGGENPGLASYISSHAPILLLSEGGLLAVLVSLSSWAAAGKYLKR